MVRSQVVFSNYPYHKMSLRYTLDSLKRLGAEKIEFVACEPHFYVDDVASNEAFVLKDMLRERDLEIVCLTAPCNEYPINLASSNPITRKRSVDYIVKHIQYANHFEAPAVQFVAGEATLREERDEAMKRAVESLAYLADIAAGYGVKLLNSYADSKLINVFSSAEEVQKAHESIGGNAFAGMTDTVFLSRCGESVKDVMETFGRELYLVEFADCKRGSGMHLALTEGDMDIDGIFADFDAAGYKGYYSLNMRGSREPYLYEEEPERCMRTAAEYLFGKL